MKDKELETKARLFGVGWDDFKLETTGLYSHRITTLATATTAGSKFCPICNEELEESIITLNINWRIARGTILKPEDEKGMKFKEEKPVYKYREPLHQHLKREHPDQAYVFCLKQSLLQDEMTELLVKFKEKLANEG